MMLLTTAMCSVWLVHSSLTAVVFGVLIGAAAASTSASGGALPVRSTGTASLGRRRGRMMAVVVTSSAVGPLLFTLLADAVGSYTRGDRRDRAPDRGRDRRGVRIAARRDRVVDEPL